MRIRKNATKKIAAIVKNTLEAHSFTLNNNFSGEDLGLDWDRLGYINEELALYSRASLTVDTEKNIATLYSNSNHWVEFTLMTVTGL